LRKEFKQPKNPESNVYKGKSLILFFMLATAMVFPAKGQYDFTANVTEGCNPLKVKFHFVNTATIDSVANLYWDFQNGTISSLMDPDTVLYNASGKYDPAVAVIFTNGSVQWVSKTDYITVSDPIPASFSYHDSSTFDTYVFESTATLNPGVDYTFTWDINGAAATGPHAVYTFPAADTFMVSLTMSDEFGCSSMTSQQVIVLEEFRVPNIITINGDALNDQFCVQSTGDVPLNVKIFSRTGVLIYEGEGTFVTWDGSTASGQKVCSGVYFYVIKALKNDPAKHFSKAGALHLYRP
jgi:gliding motility-associated-like protein